MQTSYVYEKIRYFDESTKDNLLPSLGNCYEKLNGTDYSLQKSEKQNDCVMHRLVTTQKELVLSA